MAKDFCLDMFEFSVFSFGSILTFWLVRNKILVNNVTAGSDVHLLKPNL